MRNVYDVDRELKLLKPVKYKKYSTLRRVFFNLLFMFSLNVFKPKKHLKKSVFYIEGFKKKKLKIIIIKNKDINIKRALLYLHGGGFQTEGSLIHIRLLSTLIENTDFVGIYVKYSLAPKYLFPIGLEDCYIAYKWLKTHFCLTDENISIAGESAGGNLAIGLTMLIRDRLHKSIDKLSVYYPVISHDLNTKSMKQYVDTPGWNAYLNQAMWNAYLPKKSTLNLTYASFKNANFKGLPKTYIETAEFDCLRDEGIWFAHQLEKNGIMVEKHFTKKSVHGYDAIFYSQFVKKRIQERKRFLINE